MRENVREPVISFLNDMDLSPSNRLLQFNFICAVMDNCTAMTIKIVDNGFLRGKKVYLKAENNIGIIDRGTINGRKWVKGIERELENIYDINELRKLEYQEFKKEINVSGTKIDTILNRVYSIADKSLNYRIDIEYKSENREVN